jgi:DNA-directed RNA polymerase specialized sigma24 family protein
MKKSHRNRKFTHTIDVNAGANVATQCPPAMNKAVKRALLKEIKDFNEREARKEAEVSARGGPSVDAYQQWREDRLQMPEPTEANPDILAEEDGLKYLPSKEDSEMANLLTEVRQLFSPRERQAWNLVMKHNLSYQDAADLLCLSKGTLQGYVRTARTKFKRYMEAMRDAR